MARYTIGMDYGTLSVRTVLLDVQSGRDVAYAEWRYPHGVMESHLPDGTALGKDFALQHPKDYLLGLSTIKEVLDASGVDPREVGALTVDFTTCTLLSVDEAFEPLCFRKEFSCDPHAYAKLWKHHGAQKEADRINALAEARKEPWLGRYGGRISCEWLLPKVMETYACSPAVYDKTFRFMEAGDWLSYCLTGQESHAAAFCGFKAMYDGTDYPSRDFMRELEPGLEDLFETKVSRKIVGAGELAGRLCARGAALTGLSEGTPLASPMIDAHASMPALNAVGEGEMMMVVGTSCCHIVNSREYRNIPGIAGVVKDAVVNGMYTYEAGQSGAGDCFDWFVKNCVNDTLMTQAREKGVSIHAHLRELAQGLAPGESGLLCLDWLNGNRSVLCDHSLSGLFLGVTLSTRPEELYRALIEATAFGTRMILERFEAYGLTLRSLCAAGGIPAKDPMLMQIFADVLGREIRLPKVFASGARGSAIVASVASGDYPDLSCACRALCAGDELVYRPIAKNVAVYQRLYDLYCGLHDLFGKETSYMKQLRAIAAGSGNNEGGAYGCTGM